MKLLSELIRYYVAKFCKPFGLGKFARRNRSSLRVGKTARGTLQLLDRPKE